MKTYIEPKINMMPIVSVHVICVSADGRTGVKCGEAVEGIKIE